MKVTAGTEGQATPHSPIIAVEKKVPWQVNLKHIFLQNGKTTFMALSQQTKLKKIRMQSSQMLRGGE